jgi:hypothetical protein
VLTAVEQTVWQQASTATLARIQAAILAMTVCVVSGGRRIGR